MGSKLLLPDTVLRSVFMPQNHFREPKNRREHLLSSLPIVLPVAAVTIAAAFGLLFLQGDLVERAEETVTYTAAIGADDEQVEMHVYDASNDEVEEAEEEASEMNAASSYAAKERILPAGEVEDTAELVDAYSSVPLFVSSGSLAEQGVQTRLELLEDYFPNGMYWNHIGVDTSEMTADEIAMCVTDTPCNHSVYGYGNCNIYNGLMDDFFPQYGDEMQCLGYASIISDLLFGYDAPITEFYDFDELRIGDHIRMGWYEPLDDRDGHRLGYRYHHRDGSKCRLRKLPDLLGSTDHPQRASRHGRRPYLLHALRKLKIGCSAPRQDFDVLSGHILYFPKVIRYKNTPNDTKSFGVC